MNLAVDARMLSSSGIGTYLSNVLPRLITLYRGGRVHLIGDSAELARLPWARGDEVSVVDCQSPIYSIREQVQLPRLIPEDCGLFWSPHFNIPLAYRGALLVSGVCSPSHGPAEHRIPYSEKASVTSAASAGSSPSRRTTGRTGRPYFRANR